MGPAAKGKADIPGGVVVLTAVARDPCAMNAGMAHRGVSPPYHISAFRSFANLKRAQSAFPACRRHPSVQPGKAEGSFFAQVLGLLFSLLLAALLRTGERQFHNSAERL